MKPAQRSLAARVRGVTESETGLRTCRGRRGATSVLRLLFCGAAPQRRGLQAQWMPLSVATGLQNCLSQTFQLPIPLHSPPPPQLSSHPGKNRKSCAPTAPQAPACFVLLQSLHTHRVPGGCDAGVMGLLKGWRASLLSLRPPVALLPRLLAALLAFCISHERRREQKTGQEALVLSPFLAEAGELSSLLFSVADISYPESYITTTPSPSPSSSSVFNQND